MNRDSYVLVTAAYNEAKMIEQTIRSIITQTVRPARWVIVSDGSTDCTDDIVNSYAKAHEFIALCRITEEHARNFAAQVYAINRGVSELRELEYGYLGNLDADITLQPDYFARLLEKFRANPTLGLGGGSIYERSSAGEFTERPMNSPMSVAHACQLFRRECFEDVGGAYLPLRYGGPDTYAEIMARMRKWRVKSFPDLKVFHHRPTGTADGILRAWFRQGQMDYSLGALPAFEVMKLLRRLAEKPYVLGSMTRLVGFMHGYLRHEERQVPGEFMTYLRQEQRQRVMEFLFPSRRKDALSSGRQAS